jgi:hypothetical protein
VAFIKPGNDKNTGFIAGYDEANRYVTGYDAKGQPVFAADTSPAQSALVPRQREYEDPAAAPRRPYGEGQRKFYGLFWFGWTALLAVGGLTALFSGQVVLGLFALALAALAGRYGFRIWTWRARRLTILILW